MSTCSRLTAEAALQSAAGSVLDGDAQLRDAPRALGPVGRLGGQQRQMLLVGEARHVVVGLRLEVGAQRCGPRRPAEERQPASATRLRTSAVMNTVLPERASPVTPSRTVGVARSAR